MNNKVENDPNYSFYKYDKEGNRLVYVGDFRWVRQKDLPSLKDQENWISRYRRPNIYFFEVFINILKPILLCTLINLLIYFLFKSQNFLQYICISLFYFSFYIILNITDIAIFCIRLYQKYAPIELRSRCNLEPTCSSYMILAIKKYGFIVGVIKGIKRLRRCKGDDGVDYP